MKNRIRLMGLAICASLLAGGCAVRSRPLATLYDLGPLQAAPVASTPHADKVAVSVAEIGAPAWLDSSSMYYRLAYADSQQPLAYAGSRWAGSPAEMFGQRLKARIAQAGGVALSASDSASNVPTLRIEADDFIQVFSSPNDSDARVAMRATLLAGRTLIAQKTFTLETPAQSADASGGVHALADASDAVITEIISWLSTLPTSTGK
jgi:cholesterol transport system auxiliary component